MSDEIYKRTQDPMNLSEFKINYVYGQGILKNTNGLNFGLKKQEIIKTVKEINRKNLFGEELHKIIESVSLQEIDFMKQNLALSLSFDIPTDLMDPAAQEYGSIPNAELDPEEMIEEQKK